MNSSYSPARSLNAFFMSVRLWGDSLTLNKSMNY